MSAWRVLADDERWMKSGACRAEKVPTERFFPAEQRGNWASSTVTAKAVCARCVVRGDCLAYALERPVLVGVWGGTTARERRRMRKELCDGQA